MDYTDRATCILFGDGAGAGLVEAAQPGSIRGSLVGADGAGGPHLYRTGLSIRIAAPADRDLAPGLVRQNGREVFRWAVETVSEGVIQLLGRAKLGPDAIDWFVPHSANTRISEAVCERIGVPISRTLSSIECYGNISAASIPLALSAAMAEGKLVPGNVVLLYGFGGGLVHAGMVLDWQIPRTTVA